MQARCAPQHGGWGGGAPGALAAGLRAQEAEGWRAAGCGSGQALGDSGCTLPAGEDPFLHKPHVSFGIKSLSSPPPSLLRSLSLIIYSFVHLFIYLFIMFAITTMKLYS